MELHNAFDNKAIDRAMIISKSFVKKNVWSRKYGMQW